MRDIKTFEPNVVYIPLTDLESRIGNLKVSINEKVNVGDLLGYKYGATKYPVLSPVSGTVTGVKQRLDIDGKVVDHVVIKNDFKDSHGDNIKSVETITGTTILRKLHDLNINNIDYDTLYTSLKFNTQVDTLIINGVDVNEPFFNSANQFLESNIIDIADGINYLMEVADCKEAYLFVRKGVNLETNKFEELNINVIEIVPKVGWEAKAITKLVKKPITKNLLEHGIQFNSIYTAKAVYDAVRMGLPVTKRTILLSGTAIEEPVLYEVTIGTEIGELLENITGDVEVNVGSLLTGKNVVNEEVVVSEKVNTITVNTSEVDEELVCIHCGMCNDVCPTDILPQNIMDAEIRKNHERLFELHLNECVECGACSFVCPSHINVMEWVKRGKRRIG